jgi:shikimate kinase
MAQFERPRAIFLIGFMGAGKSSVGLALARRLGWRFVDLDQRIEQTQARSIAEIFRSGGENAFRPIETAALRELLAEMSDDTPVVVALGGGAPLQQGNARLLAVCGAPMVFLDAPFDVVRQRCRDMLSMRPLFQQEEQARALYDARRPQYLKAPFRVDTGSRTAEQAAAEIVELLSLKAKEEAQ